MEIDLIKYRSVKDGIGSTPLDALQNVDSPNHFLKLKRLQEKSKSLSRHLGARREVENNGDNNGELAWGRDWDQDDTGTMETPGRPDHPDLEWFIGGHRQDHAARTNILEETFLICTKLDAANFYL